MKQQNVQKLTISNVSKFYNWLKFFENCWTVNFTFQVIVNLVVVNFKQFETFFGKFEIFDSRS